MIQRDSGILEEVIANTRIVGRYDGQGRRQQPTENKVVRFSFRSWDGSLSTLLTICEGGMHPSPAESPPKLPELWELRFRCCFSEQAVE